MVVTAVMGFWYIFATGEGCLETCQRASVLNTDGWVQYCRTEIEISTARGVGDLSYCYCVIAAAALAVVAFLLALLAAFAACIASIRRFGAVLSGIGAFFALVSFVIFVAKVATVDPILM